MLALCLVGDLTVKVAEIGSENSQSPDLRIAECHYSRVSVTFTKYTDFTRAECGVADIIDILPIDVKVQIATLSDNRNSVGLVQTLFKE
jgi:hypothetical protein